jgi:hypothetical protein
LRESYISLSPSAGFLEANKTGILESSDFTWTYYGLSGKVKSALPPEVAFEELSRALKSLPPGTGGPSPRTPRRAN